MKTLLFLTVISLFTVSRVNAQDSKLKDKDVPQAVRTAFDTQFDNAMMVDWKLKEGNNYKASFTKDLKKHFAVFSSSGELISKGEKINRNDLPTPVADAVKTGYSSSNIDEVYRVEKGGQTQYMIKLEGKKKVIYDAEGKVVKEKMKD